MTAFEQPATDTGVPFWRRPLRRSGPEDRTSDTLQTPGMQRYAAISQGLTGSQHLWMGGNTVAPGQKSADHHHGEADSGIFIVSGHPRFVFLVDGREEQIDAGPGDFIYVPAWVPHREENPSADEEAVVVLARSTPEEIVVNLPSLHSVDGIPGATEA
ncbi:MAG TPA: cupin domain-containing protein [Solirubrobacteraceae bacterium]|nr:cupin domain-containing protein [Solirubrobacteraceae bacterium]